MSIFKKPADKKPIDTDIDNDYQLFRYIDKIIHPKATIQIASKRVRKPSLGKHTEKHEYKVEIEVGEYANGANMVKTDSDISAIIEWVNSIKEFINNHANNVK